MKKGTGAVAGVDGETCPRCGSVISYEYLRAGGDIPCQGRWLRCSVCNDWIGLLEDDIGDLHLTLVLKRARGGTMDRESLDNVGHVINIVDHTLEYQHMSTVPVQVRYAQLIEGLQKVRNELIRIIAGVNPVVESRPWCCHVNCREPAAWEIVHGPSPDDNTQACDYHLAELLCDHNEVRRII